MIDYPVNQFSISERQVTELNGKKVGERVRAIINFQAIEKTKSYTILKIRHVSMLQTKRKF